MAEKLKNLFSKNTPNDLGFGTATGTGRNMNKDGTFNVKRVGEPRFRPYEMYHTLITISWTKFIFLVLCFYLSVNLVFAFIYYFIGIDHLTSMDHPMTETRKFIEGFFFSSQTLTTLGYGRVAPIGILASSVAAVESMMGLLGFALATGLLYGRFSRPQSKILYSRHAVVAPYKGATGFMFRTSNLRRNQLIEVEVEVSIGFTEPGSRSRNFLQLDLERKRINLFPTSWTIVHPIDENSPFYGRTLEDVKGMNPEIFVILKAFDDTFSQTIYSRTSYRADEIIYGAKFLPMFHQLENGITQLDLGLIDAVEKVELPQMEMNQLETT
ncbi:MAG TPA: ion channel [Bacteroidia bacterium]|nr:ion channel [Bacteroidia bacterium]